MATTPSRAQALLFHHDLGSIVLAHLPLEEIVSLFTISKRVSSVCKRALTLVTHVSLHPKNDNMNIELLKIITKYGQSIAYLDAQSCDLVPQVRNLVIGSTAE